MSEPAAPWERMTGEGTKAYAAFRQYRDGARVGELAGVPPSSKRMWASKYEWRRRAMAWDDEVHRQTDAARMEAIHRMHDTHHRAGRALMAKGAQALDKLTPSQITAGVAVRMMEAGIRIERQVLVDGADDLDQQPATATATVLEIVGDSPWDAIARDLAG